MRSVAGARRGFDSGTGDGGSEETTGRTEERSRPPSIGLQAQKADFGWAKSRRNSPSVAIWAVRSA